MPFYEHRCPAGGHVFDVLRPVEERNKLALCETHGVYAERILSVPVIHWPRSLWTSFRDVHDRSEKELARDPNIDRYDPTLPNKHKATDGPTSEELQRLLNSVSRDDLEAASRPQPPLKGDLTS